MSNTIDPKHIQLDKASFKRWGRNWKDLTKRRWLAITIFSFAVELLFGYMLLHGHPTGPLHGFAMELVAGMAFAVGLVIYFGADRTATPQQMVSTFNAGAPRWFTLLMIWLLALTLLQLLISLTMALTHMVLVDIFGPVHHAATPPPSALPLSGKSPFLDTIIRYACLGGGMFSFFIEGTSLLFVTGFSIFLLDCNISTSIRLTLIFMARNVPILMLMLGAPFMLSVLALIDGALGLLGILGLPLIALYPALFSGMVYIIARESFIGEKDNAPVTARSRVRQEQWAGSSA